MDQKDTVVFGKSVRVGYGAICPAIKEGDQEICGSIHAEGPVVFGEPSEFDHAGATLMVGSLSNDDPDCIPAVSSVGVSGLLPTAVKTRGNVFIGGDLYVTGSVDCLSTGRLEARHSVADSLPKKIDMKHPSPDQEGMPEKTEIQPTENDSDDS